MPNHNEEKVILCWPFKNHETFFFNFVLPSDSTQIIRSAVYENVKRRAVSYCLDEAIVTIL